MGNIQQKPYKTFSIGDGLKSICVPGHYSAELQEDQRTLLIYNPETNDLWIRISVITAEPKEKTENSMFDHIIKLAQEQYKEVEIVGDKSYLVNIRTDEEDGDQIITYQYEVGYKCNLILISVTTGLDNSTTEAFKSALSALPGFIASIQAVSLDKQNFFNLTDNDCQYINRRSAEILEIREEELDNFHESGETLKVIQKYLDKEKFTAQNMTELQSLGIAFGDYMQYKYPEFQWSIIYDQYGRDFCLRYDKTTITLFPQTMISKRIEDHQKINVEALLNGVLKTIKEVIETGKYSQ